MSGSEPGQGGGWSPQEPGQPQFGGQQYGQDAGGGYSQPYGQQYNQPGPGYGEPGYDGAPQQRRNGAGIAALVLGILSIILCWVGFPAIFGGVAAAVGVGIIPVLIGIVAIVLATIGIRRAGRGEATNRGVAVGGLVTGILGLLASLLFGFLAVAGAVALQKLPGDFGDTVRQATQCIQEQTSQGVDQQTAQSVCQQRIQDQIQRQVQQGQNGGGGGGY